MQLPPFDEWATVSITDSESDDDASRLAEIRTLEEEIRDREIAAASKRLEKAALEHLASSPPPAQPDRPLPKGEHKDLLDALRKYVPKMEEEIDLYQEYAVMKHIGERLRN